VRCHDSRRSADSSACRPGEPGCLKARGPVMVFWSVQVAPGHIAQQPAGGAVPLPPGLWDTGRRTRMATATFQSTAGPLADAIDGDFPPGDAGHRGERNWPPPAPDVVTVGGIVPRPPRRMLLNQSRQPWHASQPCPECSTLLLLGFHHGIPAL
jgi:hypothetical protein